MFYVFERVEGDFAVLISDQKASINIPKSEIDGQIGDVFVKDENGRYIFNAKETEKRRESIVSRHRSLFGRVK